MLQIMPSNAGPGVNETSDEKRNLPSSIISTANSPCSTASPPPLTVSSTGFSDWWKWEGGGHV